MTTHYVNTETLTVCMIVAFVLGMLLGAFVIGGPGGVNARIPGIRIPRTQIFDCTLNGKPVPVDSAEFQKLADGALSAADRLLQEARAGLLPPVAPLTDKEREELGNLRKMLAGFRVSPRFEREELDLLRRKCAAFTSNA